MWATKIDCNGKGYTEWEEQSRKLTKEEIKARIEKILEKSERLAEKYGDKADEFYGNDERKYNLYDRKEDVCIGEINILNKVLKFFDELVYED